MFHDLYQCQYQNCHVKRSKTIQWIRIHTLTKNWCKHQEKLTTIVIGDMKQHQPITRWRLGDAKVRFSNNTLVRKKKRKS